MEDQVEQILKEKILSAVESPLPELTRRDVALPRISNKAIAVIGMRRAGDLTPQVGHFKTEVPLFVSLFGLFAAMVR